MRPTSVFWRAFACEAVHSGELVALACQLAERLVHVFHGFVLAFARLRRAHLVRVVDEQEVEPRASSGPEGVAMVLELDDGGAGRHLVARGRDRSGWASLHLGHASLHLVVPR